MNKTDCYFETLAILLLLAIWMLPVFYLSHLPDTIPIHFGINGKPDAWGTKISIFMVPVISLVLFIGLSILNKFPEKFNYPVKITEENATQLYKRGTLFVRITKVVVVLIFLFIEYQICVSGDTGRLPRSFLYWAFIIPIILPLLALIMFKKKSTSNKI